MPISHCPRLVATAGMIAATSSGAAQAGPISCPVPYNDLSCRVEYTAALPADACKIVSVALGDYFECDVVNASSAATVYMISTSNGVYGFGTADGDDFCCEYNSPIYGARIKGTPYGDFLSFQYNYGGVSYEETAATSGVGNNAYGAGGNDTIRGSNDATIVDRLYGEGNNDAIEGLDGPDYMDGGFGNDTLKGNHGNDTMFGGPDNDSMNGGDGDDNVNGGLGNDIVCGGAPGMLGDFLVDGDTAAGVDKLWAPYTISHDTCQTGGGGDTTLWDGIAWTPGMANECVNTLPTFCPQIRDAPEGLRSRYARAEISRTHA